LRFNLPASPRTTAWVSVDVYSVERTGRRWMMCLEYYGGDSLRHLDLAGQREFLGSGCQIR
jgi:hypothetical protein